MSASTVGFWFLAVALIASAVWTISAKKPVYSVVGLLAHFAALAAMYLTLNAEFLAAMQIIVYSGAILVLFVFVIALLSSGVAPFSVGPNRLPHIVVPAATVVLVALGFLVYGVSHATTIAPATIAPAGAGGVPTSTFGPVGSADVFGSVADFGKALFTTHLLPFEVTALILMVAVIAVVLLTGDHVSHTTSPERAAGKRREAREAILRGGDR
jgi:NADH-quinone oxidoreductase subunit J